MCRSRTWPRSAPRLGADVPVCLAGRRRGCPGSARHSGPASAASRVWPRPDQSRHPGRHARGLPPRDAAFSPPLDPPRLWPDAAALAATLARVGNDLQAPAIALAPSIARVLEALAGEPGCLLARMSGSGATCFGLFATAVRGGGGGGPAWPATAWRSSAWRSSGLVGVGRRAGGVAALWACEVSARDLIHAGPVTRGRWGVAKR